MSTSYTIELTADPKTLGALRSRGLYIPSETLPRVFSDVTIRCVIAPGIVFDLVGQVVNATASGFYVLFKNADDVETMIDALEAPGWQPSAPAEDIEPVADALNEENPSASEDEDPASSGDEDLSETDEANADAEAENAGLTPVWNMIDTSSEISVRQQVANLSVADKLRLARGATRPVRAILVRDTEKRIHLEVVKNPKVQDDEILEFTLNQNLSPGALRWICKQKQYVRRLDLRMNLIFNRNTPQEAALQLMKTLSSGSLRRVMQSPKAREPLQRAARKKLMKDGHI